MKKYTLEEFKNYLLTQDSLGDIHYNLTEANVDKANEKLDCPLQVETKGEHGTCSCGHEDIESCLEYL